jgi:hypothetical protein
MPVHKILEFFKDVKIILTFLKNLILLGIDIISQLTILAKIVANGLQSLAEIMKTLKELIGVDKILNMIDFLVALFKPKMIESKMLMENSISPIYYNESQDYEDKMNALEGLLDSDEDKVIVDEFRYTDDIYSRRYNKDKYKYGGEINFNDEDDEEKFEEWMQELEDKGNREIVAYRSPILTEDGEDFQGWIFYFANAYDNMEKFNNKNKQRRKSFKKNKTIKKAAKKNKLNGDKLVGGVAQLRKDETFGYYDSSGKYKKNSMSAFDAYYWYTKWTNDPTDCTPDFQNIEYIEDEDGNLIPSKPINKDVITPIMTTANGSMVELTDGRRVFVEGTTVKSGDFVNVNGIKYRVK